jgi:hypothetical protein
MSMLRVTSRLAGKDTVLKKRRLAQGPDEMTQARMPVFSRAFQANVNASQLISAPSHINDPDMRQDILRPDGRLMIEPKS